MNMEMFSKLPVELIRDILIYDGKIIMPKMDKKLQYDIINYYENTDKYIVFYYNFYPRKGGGGLMSLYYYGSIKHIIVNGKDLILTFQYNYYSPFTKAQLLRSKVGLPDSWVWEKQV